jgi:hypothetical protein
LKIKQAGLFCLALCAVAAPSAQAQMMWTDQAFVNVSGGMQTGSRTLATASSFPLYEETATVTTSQDVEGGGFFDVSGGYKVHRNLAVGLGYSRTGSTADAAIAASIPSPAVHDQFRSVTASSTDLKHNESALHFTATWMMPVTDKIDVGVFAGPTIFMVEQDVPASLTVTEPGPAINAVSISTTDKSSAGFHLGVDVAYMITPRFGVGGLARYTRGSIEIEGAADDEKLAVGGFQIGAGLRVRF